MLPTIEHLAAELAAGRATSLALTEAALARAHDPAGEGARVFTRIDAARALASARASDLLRGAGIVRSPLEGLPVSIKDLFDVAGQPTPAGSALLRDAAPARRNAAVVDRLVAAGAVIVGRTNMTEFAYSGLGLNPHYGTPRNPWGREGGAGGRIPGGSSSGAAVSVTDGMAVAAVGSDTGGSVRIPSALCGLAGFKPTARRVPLRGALPLSTTLDSIGPLAASVRCCAIVDAVLAGEPVDVRGAAPLGRARLAVPEGVALDGLDAAVAQAFDAACAALRAAGARVERIALPEFAELAQINTRGSFTAAEAWAWHRGHIATARDAYDPRVVSRIELGARMGAADFIDLLDARRRWIAAVEARIAGFDALLMPTVPCVAPAIDLLARDEAAYFAANGLMLRNPTFINFLDGCALSLPCHAPGTAPVGLMLAAAGGADRRILALGQAAEAALRGPAPAAAT
ncbi:amidase [Ramlibacter sp. H39-3-26]|uniref:amidase n=1 Tax=Curvibacter soli TaxID=3031331 RepID=UPI0023DB8C8C|nr:amidase [Ramlibacter sp. H39-3-26]MDF1485031.1 amidase [Ramlibacter sp. H39-3-26]